MRILFMGSGEISLPTLDWLLASPEHQVIGLVCQPDKPTGRKQILTAAATKARLASTAIPVLQPLRIRRPEEVEKIRQLAPEVIVVIAYGQILPQELLDIPPVACLNLHASLLPRHRGAAPIQAAILAGDPETGMTLMLMDAGLDTGDMVLQEKIAIGSAETAGELHDRLGLLAPQVLARGLALLADGQASHFPQNSHLATVSGKLTRESGQIFWTESAAHLARLVRAMNPWPGAFMLLPDGRKCKIHAATATEATGQPGEILRAEAGELLIATSQGALRLDELQLEGKNRLAAADFLRGHPLPVGKVLPFPA